MESIIKKGKLGDYDSIIYIIEKYKGFIIKKAKDYIVPGYNFEDLVQHGYLSVIKAIHKYKLGSNSYNGYFLNAIDLNFKALLKGEIKHYREIPDNNILNKDKEYKFTLEDEIIAYDEVKKLYDAIDKLKDIEKKIIIMYYIDSRTLKEISRLLDIKYSSLVYCKKKS